MARLYVLTGCRKAFQWRADNGLIAHAHWVSISFESYMYLFLDSGYVFFSGVRFVSVNVSFYINLLSTPPFF